MNEQNKNQDKDTLTADQHRAKAEEEKKKAEPVKEQKGKGVLTEENITEETELSITAFMDLKKIRSITRAGFLSFTGAPKNRVYKYKELNKLWEQYAKRPVGR